MSDDQSTTTTPPAETAPPAGTEQPNPQTTPPVDPPKEEEIPADVLRKELTSVRAEAANYRTKLRETEQKLASAKTPEEFEAARTELTTKVAELEKAVLVATVARKFNLDDDLAGRLVGSTAEELEADAKKLQKYAPVKEINDPQQLNGGLDPNGDDEPFDPVKAAREARKRF